MRPSFLAIGIFAALARVATAQPGLAPPGMQAELPAPVRSTGGELSESTGLALSLGGTAASYAAIVIGAHMRGDDGDAAVTLGVIGTVFAPSAGHWYAGAGLTRGLGIRFLGLGAALAGALVSLSECPLFSDGDCNPQAGPALVVVGAGAYVVGTVDDIITVPSRVRHRNAELAGTLAVVPTVVRGGGGVSVAGRF